MNLSTLDISIVISYLTLTLAVGLYFSRRATKSVDEYFVGGRSMPWWLAGTSMIASALSVDTPIGITGLVAKHGVQGVWFAWSYIIGGVGAFGAFIFAALLRRSRIITAAELMELRYSGKEAAFLRGFKGIYFGVVATCISMAWNIKAVLIVSQEAFGWDALPALTVVIGITLLYATASGIWGVVTTDFFQFFVATTGSLALAYFAMQHIGGAEGIYSGMATRYGAEAVERMRFIPRPSSEFFHVFIVFITLKWWGNPSGVETQRIMASKDERHATFATFLFTIVHFAMNYWPMILVALASLITYPDLAKPEHGYARLMVQLLPTGFLGIMLASQASAVMSTIESQMNMGASYMVNDIYRRFIKKDASPKHYVRASQASTVIMLALAVCIAFFQESVEGAWKYLAILIGGYGFVVVARWFWWRINAWAEITALCGSAIGAILANHVLDLSTFGTKFAFTAGISMVCWITVALLTPPCPMDKLADFCRAVKPYPAFWGPVYRAYPDIEWSPNLLRNCGLWMIGMLCAYCICFGLGNILLGSSDAGYGLLAAAVVGILVLVKYWRP